MSHPHQPTSPFGQPPSPFGPHPYPPQPQRKHTALKVAAGVVGGLLVFGVGVAAGSGNTEAKVKAKPAPTVTVTVTAEARTPKTQQAASGKPKTKAEPAEQPKKDAPEATISQGSYLVGKDVDAGTYRTGGPSDSDIPLCYWARNKDSSGELDSIIANGTPQGPARVTINKGEIFETNGCEEWKKVS
ncbi:hypothetical protein [Streptomyces sp. NPDC017993]|uniref:hypothetical protein n=1 Tax=Streptomyces sp. NPDC017993 TaxID=3365027 RepID=UPI0037880AD0